VAVFEFARFHLPEPVREFTAAGKARFKGSLLALIVSQRIEIFEREGGLTPWVEHSQRYRAALVRRNKKRGAHDAGNVKILQDSGILRSSFTGKPFGPGGAEGLRFHAEWMAEDEVGIATIVEYAPIQNHGGVIANGFGRGIAITIPARPFDEFTDPNLEEIQQLTEAFINGEL
jgi:hypothetical protein